MDVHEEKQPVDNRRYRKLISAVTVGAFEMTPKVAALQDGETLWYLKDAPEKRDQEGGI